jgi:XTP/dITP diphosphohydrolase
MDTLKRMPAIPFVFVTQSEGKLAEAKRIFGERLRYRLIPQPGSVQGSESLEGPNEADPVVERIRQIREIQSVELRPVVEDKALKTYEIMREPVMVEDTGLFIEAWGGFPGALVKWLVESVGGSGICRMMKEFPDRNARAETAAATYDGHTGPLTFFGTVHGQIALVPSGYYAFGWGDIFVPDGTAKTYGEMPAHEKDRYSMRRRAFEAVASYYSETGDLGL